MNKLRTNKRGITVLGVIILILGIIILIALIRFFARIFGTDKFKAFKNDFSEFRTAIGQDYLNKKSKLSSEYLDEEIYCSIASGISVESAKDVDPAGNLGEFGLDIKTGRINGSDFFEIKDDRNILNVKSKYKFYDSSEKHYITDAGDVFILPGFKVEEDDVTKWYVNDSVYYESKNPIKNLDSIKFDNIRITTDPEGNEEAGKNLKRDTKLYITMDAFLNGEKIEIVPSVPFEITYNGKYEFVSQYEGRKASYTVEVDNYKTKNPTDILKIGDYISYSPDSKSCKVSKDENGHSSQMFRTDSNAIWKVIYINKDTEDFWITTDGCVNAELNFNGMVGFSRGVDTLNRICRELYSNNKLGLIARSMTIEDANTIFENKPPENQDRYAYFPRGTSISGPIEFSGETYNKTTNDWRTSRFYYYDGGGVEKTDNYGIVYREPEADNPVFITQTFYSYKIKDSAASKIIGDDTAWLASQSVYTKKSGAGMGLRIINSEGVDAETLYDSYSNQYTNQYGIHPIVEVKYSDYSIDTSDAKRNGSTKAKAWVIVKDEH